MPTFDSSWTGRLRVIGELERPDHWYLTEQDQCAFFGEYTARAGYSHSATNQLIANLKKKPSTRGTPQWPHKQRAIRDIGATIKVNLLAERIPHLTFVPIPPSKLPDHPDYDNRMTCVARAIAPGVDVRELIVATVGRDAAHECDDRPGPDALRATLAIQTNLLNPAPEMVILVDDMLTTGCSFRVCKSMIQEELPGVPVAGLFVARRVIEHGACEFNILDI